MCRYRVQSRSYRYRTTIDGHRRQRAMPVGYIEHILSIAKLSVGAIGGSVNVIILRRSNHVLEALYESQQRRQSDQLTSGSHRGPIDRFHRA